MVIGMKVPLPSRHRRGGSTANRLGLAVVVGVPLVGVFLLNPALAGALSAAGTVVALVLKLGERDR
jgi:hypothetical protein